MKPRLNQRLQFSLAYLLVAATVLLVLQAWLQAPRTVEIPMSKFLELLRSDRIERVALTERELRGLAKPGADLEDTRRAAAGSKSPVSVRRALRGV